MLPTLHEGEYHIRATKHQTFVNRCTFTTKIRSRRGARYVPVRFTSVLMGESQAIRPWNCCQSAFGLVGKLPTATTQLDIGADGPNVKEDREHLPARCIFR